MAEVRAMGGDGVTLATLHFRDQLAADALENLGHHQIGHFSLTWLNDLGTLWLVIRREGRGGLAVRAAANVPSAVVRSIRPRAGEAARYRLTTKAAVYEVGLRLSNGAARLLRITKTVTANAPVLPAFEPRDLLPLDEHDDPLGATGTIEAAQRGLNSGLLYFRLTRPSFGSVLYFQNLTALNPYFKATDSKPDGVVGGRWPEIGFLPPTGAPQGAPGGKPLPIGQSIVVSDALITLHDDEGGDEQEMARRFLSLLSDVIQSIDTPRTEYRDWMGRAERSLADLAGSPKATIRHYGHRYVHPYTAAEYPDSMVQLSVLSSLRDYETWAKTTVPIGAELAAGLGKFYDAKRRVLRRYLPNVGKDKDRFAVDSWYLFHPLLQLGRLAVDGDKAALRLFRKSIEFGIRSAHHFAYAWPIQYDLRDFRVITEARDDAGRGQTDVGGIYAYVMLQAFELTDEKRYLDEARAAIDAAKGIRFELNYQANLTAWGAAACLRLWRITNDDRYLRQSYVYLASFFHNTAIWESDIGHARHYRNFLGATALHDAPYMALYECFDSFAAFEQCLKDSGPEFDVHARMLVNEYCRYALDRAWFYYPDALPADAIAEEQRESNGHIDPTLSFPVEDLYVDGQPAGQVGQEIYGMGAALVFASRAFHHVPGAPFRIFCDHFIMSSERSGERSLTLQPGGTAGRLARLSIVSVDGAELPQVTVTTAAASPAASGHRSRDRIDFQVPADQGITVSW